VSGVRQLSLAPLTLPMLQPADFLSCAARAGFRHVALRAMAGSPHADPGDMPALLRETHPFVDLRARIAGEGLTVTELEYVLLDARSHVEEHRPLFELGVMLGARHVVVGTIDPEPARAAEIMDSLGRLAREHGLRIEIEFVPYGGPRTLDAACALAAACSAGNVGVLIDAIHFARAGHVPADIDRWPTVDFAYVQMCDAPAAQPSSIDEVIRQAREERLDPGEGGLDLRGILGRLPGGLPVSLEIPNLRRVAAIGPVAHAVRVREAMAALLNDIAQEECP
jgi:sugar phosphate isomerase/epimerase